jgi:amino acid transporter
MEFIFDIVKKLIATVGLVSITMLILTAIFLLFVPGQPGWMQFLGYSSDYDYGFAIGGMMNFTMFLGIGAISAMVAGHFIEEYENKIK